MVIENCIAERRLILRHSVKGERVVLLQIGAPYAELSGARWACPVWLNGLEPKSIDIRGMDALQSLNLALRFAKTTLISYQNGGYRVLWPGGSEVHGDYF